MAKDPAFLFYSADFMMGTALMSETEVGQYIRILCHMHQSGRLSMEDMLNICPHISSRVVGKLMKDDQNRYYSVRLEEEVEKRKKYSESRKKNRLNKTCKSYDNTYVKSYVDGMSTHMENENINSINNKIKESKFIGDYYQSAANAFTDMRDDELLLENLLLSLSQNGFKTCTKIILVASIKAFLTDQMLVGDYFEKNCRSEVKRHLGNWLRKVGHEKLTAYAKSV